MDVPVSQFRAELKSWIEAAQGGETIVITDRGVPVARLSGVDAAPLIQELQASGELSSPSVPRQTLEPAARTEAKTHEPLVSGFVRRLRR